MSPQGRLRRRGPGGADREDARHAEHARRAAWRPITTRPASSRACSTRKRACSTASRNTCAMIPAYDPKFFRVAEPAEPRASGRRLYHLLAVQPESGLTSFDDILARLVDGSEHMEFRPGYGPEVYTGLVKIDGMLVGAIGNRQGLLPKGYPEYADYPGIGGKLYRQGLIKMNEFVTLCGRDRVPIDLVPGHLRHRRRRRRREGGAARPRAVADLLDPADRRADDAGGAAQGQRGGPLPHGRPHGQPPQRLHPGHRRDRDLRHARRDRGGRDLLPAARSRTRTRASRCEPLAREDERDGAEVLRHVAPGLLRRATASSTRSSICSALRGYLKAFAGAVYQNPKSICPRHQMLLPRIIRG